MNLIVDIRDHGAVGDGATVNTKAINKAIETASSNGAGTVIVPPGTYMTGTIFLRSNLTLEIRPGAMLKAAPDHGEYPELPPRDEYPPHLARKTNGHRHFVFADTCENVRICGGGVLDGNVAAFTPNWETKKPFTWTGASKRPFVPMIEIYKSRNVRLEDITIQNSPGWTCHLCFSDQIWIERVHLNNYVFSGNSDGFDVDGCRDVFFANCRLETGDDCIVLKSFPKTRSCERITVTGCVLKTLCAALKIGTESWHDFRNITFSNSVVYESSRAFQITCLDGATVEDVTVSNITVDTNTGNLMNRPIHLDLAKRHHGILPGISPEEQPPIGKIRRISISNIICTTDGRIICTAADGSRLEHITMRDITFNMPWIEDPHGPAGESDKLQCSFACPDARRARAAVVAQNIKNFRLEGLSVIWPQEIPPETFLPKYQKGEIVHDPRKEFDSMPPFHAFWGKGIDKAIIDIPFKSGSTPETEPIHLENATSVYIRDDK